jgi:hypothetical protein
VRLDVSALFQPPDASNSNGAVGVTAETGGHS